MTSAFTRLKSSTSVAGDRSAAKWEFFGAMCLERPPVVACSLSDVEQRASWVFRDMEFERSLKCDHELAAEKEKKYAIPCELFILFSRLIPRLATYSASLFYFALCDYFVFSL